MCRRAWLACGCAGEPRNKLQVATAHGNGQMKHCSCVAAFGRHSAWYGHVGTESRVVSMASRTAPQSGNHFYAPVIKLRNMDIQVTQKGVSGDSGMGLPANSGCCLLETTAGAQGCRPPAGGAVTKGIQSTPTRTQGRTQRQNANGAREACGRGSRQSSGAGRRHPATRGVCALCLRVWCVESTREAMTCVAVV